MKNRWVTVLPKNYRRIVLAAIERAVDPVLFMNGEQGRRQAEAFADRLHELSDSDAIERGYWLALGRGPAESELQLAAQFLDQATATHASAGAADPRRQARSDFCQALFGMNEFVYVE